MLYIENKILVPLGLVMEFSVFEFFRRHDNHLFILIRETNGMKILNVLLNEPSTKKAWCAVIEHGCLAETGNE